ncbi:MAG TPA: nucleoid-associated protein [Ohtaekwangia sp.]|nr:nucleoid-associated protein [Ohtaekwangia sp.]
MIDPLLSSIEIVSVHTIGNAALEEPSNFSQKPLPLDTEEIHRALCRYFLSSFTTPEYYAFNTAENPAGNVIRSIAGDIFSDAQSFHTHSIAIAKHLFAVSTHPNIKPGDLFVARLSGVTIGNAVYEALGLFKSENKETYLKLRNFSLGTEQGININALDKGCLILKTDEEAGYKILIVDKANKTEAQFWKQDFLNISPWPDGFHHTRNFMDLTRQYVADQMDEEFAVSRADQIDLLNRSMRFFKSHEEFNKAAFETEVLGDVDVIESFRNYGKNFMAENNVEVADNFEISAHAVQRQARVFKSVLKLDKNFHVYIHGNRQLIEKGFDEAAGKHFYKLYFDEES